MDDTISRQAAINAIDEQITARLSWITDSRLERQGLDVARIVIEDLPSAQSERKTGEWLYKKVTEDFHVTGQCSVCKERRRIDNFCPNCGADMRGDGNEIN